MYWGTFLMICTSQIVPGSPGAIQAHTCIFFLLFAQLIVWNDGLTVTSWAGYIIAYVLMSLGVYLISDIDFLVKQGKDLQDFQEIVLADIYHPYATIFDNRAADQLFSRTQLEMNMSRHQLTILHHTRRQGLKRGNSYPEMQSPSTRSSFLGLDESTRSTLRFEGLNTESGHFSSYEKRESINSIALPTRN
jgi:hypothetical protein